MLVTETCYYSENQVFMGVKNQDMLLMRHVSARDYTVFRLTCLTYPPLVALLKSLHRILKKLTSTKIPIV